MQSLELPDPFVADEALSDSIESISIVIQAVDKAIDEGAFGKFVSPEMRLALYQMTGADFTMQRQNYLLTEDVLKAVVQELRTIADAQPKLKQPPY